METISLGEKSARVFYPPSYQEAPTRRFPLLLSLGELEAAACARRLHAEGVLPEIIVAEMPAESDGIDLRETQNSLLKKLRLLDSSSARWIVGTAHHAVQALETVLHDAEIFGNAACLSTSFEGSEGAPPLHSPMLRRLEELSSLPSGVRLYFDYGTLGIDECYEPYHRDLGAILRSNGWRDGREFQIVRNTGGASTLESWQERLDPALRWLAAK